MLRVLVTRKIQIRTTMRKLFTPTTIAGENKTDDKKYWWGNRDIRTLIHC